jgi:hypothetical protein
VTPIVVVLMTVVSFWIVLPFSAGPVRVNLPNIIQSLTPKKKQPSPNLQYPLFAFFGLVSLSNLIIFVVNIFNNSPQ